MKKILSVIVSMSMLIACLATAMSANAASYIGTSKAKKIALEDAGVQSSMASFTSAKLDYDDGIRVYDIEFHTDLAEYEYEINAASGEIKDKDKDLWFSINLSSTKYTYNGKAKKPSVTLKKRDGSTISSAHYTVSYSNNVKPGKGKVTIKFNNKKYTGKFTKKFTIKPKKQKVTSVKRSGTTLTIKWKRDKTVSGYRIQYSTKSDFSNAKTIRISGNSNVSKVIKGVKKQKYYVRIRAYKTYKTERIYGAWSANGTTSTSITLDKAKKIALDDAGLKASQVTFTTAKQDYEDGVNVYEIEFIYNGYEYEYVIKKSNGKILERDCERAD